ncbi:MAG: carbamate kinase [Candidatus Krumholzibacteria bacterium]|nr:carbamate kinase [Candidatus Krumholzibacteria bacterium]
MAVSGGSTAGLRLVIALGGNAIIPVGQEGTYEQQTAITRETMKQVARLAADGNSVVMTHGNGPVVGNIVLRNDAGMSVHGIPPMPMFVCGADSQGGLGFMLQQSLQNALSGIGLDIPVATVVTQVLVDRGDPAFAEPVKPIGPFYDEEQAGLLRDENGWTIVRDAGRGWRRVVPSPAPRKVIEWEAIRTLVEAGVLTIATGGGGVPVIRNDDGLLEGVDAVIDKDRAAALLGGLIGADVLIIVTQVEKVCVRFGQPDEEALDVMTVDQATKMLAEGEFPPGSMGPKIESAVSFISGGGKSVIITSSEHILAAVAGDRGTTIIPA